MRRTSRLAAMILAENGASTQGYQPQVSDPSIPTPSVGPQQTRQNPVQPGVGQPMSKPAPAQPAGEEAQAAQVYTQVIQAQQQKFMQWVGPIINSIEQRFPTLAQNNPKVLQTLISYLQGAADNLSRAGIAMGDLKKTVSAPNTGWQRQMGLAQARRIASNLYLYREWLKTNGGAKDGH